MKTRKKNSPVNRLYGRYRILTHRDKPQESLADHNPNFDYDEVLAVRSNSITLFDRINRIRNLGTLLYPQNNEDEMVPGKDVVWFRAY